MKRTLVLSFLLLSLYQLNAQVKFDALQVVPGMPKQGQTVSFTYDSRLSPLMGEKPVEILVYLYGKKGYKIMEPTIVQKGSLYSGTFKPDSNTACIVFGISAKERKIKDNNGGKGYIIPVYLKDNVPVTDYYFQAARLFAGEGENLFGMRTDHNKNLALMEEVIRSYPEVRANPGFNHYYLDAVRLADIKEGDAAVLLKLKELASQSFISEDDYATISQWYQKLKMKSMADSFSTNMKEKYPGGTWKKNEMASAITKSKGAENKKAALEAYLKAYPPKTEELPNIYYYRGHVAEAFHKEKNDEEFKLMVKDLPMAKKASLYNDLAWGMAEDKENISRAKLMSFEATNWAKKEMTNPSGEKPAHLTKKDWAKERKGEYAMYADTYAFILFNQGDYKNGYPYAREAANHYKFTYAEYNERYAQLMVKVVAPAVAKKEMETFVKNGSVSAKTKALLKDLYMQEHGSDKGYATYLAKLETAAREKQRNELAKAMLNEVAPRFALKDLEGKEVSLESLRGKIVVLDFWATWCGPCIESMPAMKSAQEKLQAKGDVVFLFVDTWESGEKQKENADNFMKKNNYPFHVLLDEENKVVAEFKVQGIPTKFVIDKRGNIRFRSVGFGGNDDALVNEVSVMVEMASSEMPVRKYVK